MPSFQPYWGKPAVRNDRGDRGDVGIIRSPVRASILPDCGGCPAMGIPTAILGQLLSSCSCQPKPASPQQPDGPPARSIVPLVPISGSILKRLRPERCVSCPG